MSELEKLDFEMESWNVIGKPWDKMTRDEKLAAYDHLTRAFNQLADAMRKDFDEILAEGKCTLRTTVKILIDINPNDDPRLP